MGLVLDSFPKNFKSMLDAVGDYPPNCLVEFDGPAEIDAYAEDYRGLLRNPWREWFATHSDLFFQRKLDLIREFLGRKGLETKGLCLLDVGCGRWDLLRLGQQDFLQAVGCDPSPKMLAACGELSVRLQPTTDELSFSDESFDLVTMVCVLHYVPTTTCLQFITEARRTLRPGGWLCLIENNPFNPVTRSIVRGTTVDRNARLLTASEVAFRLVEGGFSRPELRYFLHFPEWLFAWLGALEHFLGGIPFGGRYALVCPRALCVSDSAVDPVPSFFA